MACDCPTLPESWWQDRDLFVKVLANHDAPVDAAAAHGVASNTLSTWRAKHGLPRLTPGPKPKLRPVQAVAAAEDVWLLDALKKLGDTATVEQLADHSDVAPKKVRDALERLGRDGYRVEQAGERIVLDRQPRPTDRTVQATPALFDGDKVRFAIVSDVHLGSKAERLDELNLAYQMIAREGIRVVYNAGDLVDGIGIYKGQISETYLHTFEEQRDHAAESYPHVNGVETQIIAGNHDLEGEIGRIGADPVRAVANLRDDIVYLGAYSARVELPNGGSIDLLHPMGGASYALSYRPQKIVESYEGGEKPSCLIIGHWHRAGYFTTRGVQVLLAGTFQGPTTYSVRKAFGESGFGFWLVEATMAADGSLVRFKSEWMPYYAGRRIAA